MKILITGAAGYVGGSLFKALDDKHIVTNLTRKELDLTDAQAVGRYMSMNYFDVILHCAAKGGSRLAEDDWSVLENNLKAVYNLTSNESSFGKFIHFGSGAEIYAADEPYGLSKYIINKHIQTKPNTYNLRIYGVFDEHETDTRFIKANVSRYIRREDLMIHQNKHMDFFYMPDLVKLVEHYIETEPDRLDKIVECRYETTNTLGGIAAIINMLDEHKVAVNIRDEFGGAYMGTTLPPELDYIGLEEGIRNVYNALK